MTLSESAEREIACRLMDAHDRATMLPPISRDIPDLDVPAAYRVLARIESERIAQGWKPLGRKIGFTNTTIWERYGVYQPMWARVWAHTVHEAHDNVASLSLAGIVQPRIEPEVVFGLASAPRDNGDPVQVLDQVAWLAPGFEIVQSHFPDWKFNASDCTAAFGLHGALVVGTRVPMTANLRETLSALLPHFHLTLRKGETVVDRGVGSNVLGGPAHALTHLVRVLAQQPDAPRLAAGEIVTTGTVTDAWPVKPGETWTTDYGELPLTGLRLTFT